MDRIVNLSLRTKKRLTNISTGLFFLFGGIEYAIIMPTVYLYIQSLGGDPSFLGLVLSAFSVTGLIAAPIFGLLQDRYHNTKVLVLVANMFEIVGNFMYFVGLNLVMLLGSRLIAGIGAGVGSSLFAQIARTTTETERAAAISMAMAARQIGLLFGPGLNLFLQHLDFYIGPWKVDHLSSAGIFMCLLWILLQIFIFFFYFELPPLTDNDHKQNQVSSNVSTQSLDRSKPQGLSRSVSILSSGRPKNTSKSMLSQSLPTGGLSSSFEEGGVVNIAHLWASGSLVEDPRPRAFSMRSASREQDHIEDRQDVMQNVDLDTDNFYDAPQEDGLSQFPALETVKEDENNRNGSSGYESAGQEGSGDSDPQLSREANRPSRSWKDEYLREEVIVLLASQFIFLFNQTVLETALTPMTQRLFNFGELENSILYCICGVELILGFVLVKYLSKFVSDRALLMTGFLIELSSFVWLLIFYPRATPGPSHKSYNMMWFAIGTLVEVSGLAFLAVSIITLFSKVTAIETQGFSQGIRRAVGGLATIMGPLWAGGTVERAYVMFGVMAFLFAFIICLMLLSWPKLKSTADIKQNAKLNLPTPDDSNDEKSPLLINADDGDIEA